MQTTDVRISKVFSGTNNRNLTITVRITISHPDCEAIFYEKERTLLNAEATADPSDIVFVYSQLLKEIYEDIIQDNIP